MKSWLGLGSNLDQPVAQLRNALIRLEKAAGIEVLRRSSFYRTPPWGDAQQGDFINAVVQIDTGLEPLPLLRVLQSIEDGMGRQRSPRRWGPRLIDIDLLLYADQTFRTPELVLPHPRMWERAFVLLPIFELDEMLEIPGYGTVRTLLGELDISGISRLEEGGRIRGGYFTGADAG